MIDFKGCGAIPSLQFSQSKHSHSQRLSGTLQELLPEKRLLRHPNLAKAVGSDALAARVAALAPEVHVFGHTHFSWDARLPSCGAPGTRFVQWPLAYPSERRCVW